MANHLQLMSQQQSLFQREQVANLNWSLVCLEPLNQEMKSSMHVLLCTIDH